MKKALLAVGILGAAFAAFAVPVQEEWPAVDTTASDSYWDCTAHVNPQVMSDTATLSFGVKSGVARLPSDCLQDFDGRPWSLEGIEAFLKTTLGGLLFMVR